MIYTPTARFNMGWLNDTLSIMNDRINALEAEHESAVDAFEDGFAAGEARATEKFVKLVPAPEMPDYIDLSKYQVKPAPEVEPIDYKCRGWYEYGKGYHAEFLTNSYNDYEKLKNLIERYNAGEIA